MNREEKQAIKILKSFEPIDLFEGAIYLQALEKLTNLIEKLQKENEKYKQFFDLMLRLDSDYFMNCGDEGTIKLVDEILKLESE